MLYEVITHGKIRRDQRRQTRLEPRQVLERFGQVEVEPPALCPHLPAGHGPGHQRRQQVQRGVHAHVAMAPLPVELLRDAGAGGRQGGA